MTLTSLPTELIEHIAIYLDLPTFRSLRLVCVTLNEQSLHPFKDNFFRSRTLKWTRYDFDRLLLITDHEIFGPALQHLLIDATPRHSIALWQLRKRISDAEAIFSDIHGVSFRSELHEKYINDEKVAKDLTTFYNETRYDQKCLQTVFETIKGLESVVFEYEGMDKMYGKFCRRYCESSQHEMSRPFVSTLAAVAASRIHVKTITIHNQNHYGAVSIGRLESLAPSLRNFDHAFEKLEALKLNLRDWRYPDTGFELENTRAPFVIRFLAKARNVRYLYLSSYSSLDEDLFGDMAQHCKFAQLETCHLSLFRIQNASDIIDFFQSSSSTLKELCLSHIVLRDEETTWPELVRNLLAPEDMFPDLQVLDLDKMFTRTGARLVWYGHPNRHRLLWEREDDDFGRGWRTSVPSRLDDFYEGVSGPAWHFAAVAYPFVGMRT